MSSFGPQMALVHLLKTTGSAGTGSRSWKHAPRIFKENGNVLFPNGFAGSTSLVDGPFLSTHGQRDGLIEIRHPGGQAAPLVLDFRDSHNPVYGDNLGALPGPWVERCDALGAFALGVLTDISVVLATGTLAVEVPQRRARLGGLAQAGVDGLRAHLTAVHGQPHA